MNNNPDAVETKINISVKLWSPGFSSSSVFNICIKLNLGEEKDTTQRDGVKTDNNDESEPVENNSIV